MVSVGYATLYRQGLWISIQDRLYHVKDYKEFDGFRVPGPIRYVPMNEISCAMAGAHQLELEVRFHCMENDTHSLMFLRGRTPDVIWRTGQGCMYNVHSSLIKLQRMWRRKLENRPRRLAVAMSRHARLGAASPLGVLDFEVVDMIMSFMTTFD
jgi:hypothetical protein